MRTLRALAALLAYPTQPMIDALDEIGQAIDRENLLPARERAALGRLVDDLRGGDLYDLQERYGLLFDRTRSLSLHLFEHVHGESRDRGQAMVDLLKLYQDSGWMPVANELPDFLPLFLEYASTRQPAEAIALVGQPANVLAALAERLAKRQSAYGAIMTALLALSKAKPDAAALAALRAEPDPEPDDLAALDAAWTDEEVTFGPGSNIASGIGTDAASCPVDRMARRLQAAVPSDKGVSP
ncbi:MAG: nitrate reductase molybdenum cofactor assembly chaperone [Proteobacteria bacterium]|nr:nitrate reductase molybdenum cofactor assembly chaperone [Pseudomonadota bacterium]